VLQVCWRVLLGCAGMFVGCMVDAIWVSVVQVYEGCSSAHVRGA
jgi:hypothetical protein